MRNATIVPGLMVLATLVLMILFITTNVDAHIAYIAYENDWKLIAWLFSRSYPSL